MEMAAFCNEKQFLTDEAMIQVYNRQFRKRKEASDEGKIFGQTDVREVQSNQT